MKGKSAKKGRDWIFEKKERRRRQGRYVHDFCFKRFMILCWNIHVLNNVIYFSFNTRWRLFSLCCAFAGLQGGSSRHKIHRTSEKTSFLALAYAVVPSLALVCTRPHTHRLWKCRVFGLIFKLFNSSGWDEKGKKAITADRFYIWLSVCFSQMMVRLHSPGSSWLEDRHLYCLCVMQNTVETELTATTVSQN